MTYLGIKQAKELGQFLILPKALHMLLFAWIKILKAPFIPMSSSTWSYYMQNLSWQVNEANNWDNWGHLENSRELWLTQVSNVSWLAWLVFRKVLCTTPGHLYQKKWLYELKFLCQVLSSWIFLLFKFNQSGKWWDYHSWIVSASRSFHSQILVLCFCLSRTKGLTFPNKEY